MNWDAIGALAEAIGAIAVIVTLVYLAIQLRQNTRAIERSTERGVFDDANDWMYKIIESQGWPRKIEQPVKWIGCLTSV